MKTLYLFSLLTLSLFGLNAQSDTLYINDTHILPIIFPEPIERAITGHPNYTFGYNLDTPERLGLLQGNPGTDSNLLVLTRDGLAYSYYLTYREKFIKSHWFVDIEESIGCVSSKRPMDLLDHKEASSTLSVMASDSVRYLKFSEYLLDRKTRLHKSKRKYGLVLRLLDIAYHGKETYIVLEIENRSDINFEVAFVELYRLHGNPRKRASFQKLILKPLYIHGMPEKVKAGQRQRMVCVMPKFTLSKREKLLVNFTEKLGSRSIVMKKSP